MGLADGSGNSGLRSMAGTWGPTLGCNVVDELSLPSYVPSPRKVINYTYDAVLLTIILQPFILSGVQ